MWLALTIIAFSIKHWTGLAPRRVPSEAGRYLFAHSDPADRIFVWGQSPEIYLDARQASCLPLHHNLPAHGLCFRRTDPGFRYSQPDLARRLDHSGARFCQASADLHCRCSPRPEKCALSSEELSDSGQTLGGTIPASGAHCRRGDLSDALGLTSWLECDHFWKYRLVALKSVRPLKENVNWRPAGMTDARLISGGLSHPRRSRALCK